MRPETEGVSHYAWEVHGTWVPGEAPHCTSMARPAAQPPPARLPHVLCHTLPAGIRPTHDHVGAQGGGCARGTPAAGAGTSQARARNPARVLRMWPGRRVTRSGLQVSAHRGVSQPRMEAGSRVLLENVPILFPPSPRLSSFSPSSLPSCSRSVPTTSHKLRVKTLILKERSGIVLPPSPAALRKSS